MKAFSRARPGDRGALTVAWVVAAVVLWSACVPLSWFVVNGVHVLVTEAHTFPASLGESAFSYVYAGVLPLIATLLALWWLSASRGGRLFRIAAIAVSLFFGSWFGFYLVGADEVVIQLVLVAWGLFGSLVPRAVGAVPVA
jgi:hypothetical protein